MICYTCGLAAGNQQASRETCRKAAQVLLLICQAPLSLLYISTEASSMLCMEDPCASYSIQTTIRFYDDRLPRPYLQDDVGRFVPAYRRGVLFQLKTPLRTLQKGSHHPPPSPARLVLKKIQTKHNYSFSNPPSNTHN